ncbi:WXG100 family type VII secretion target [Nocardia tenerifensis]|uniref:ESAT-6-like protein n=1 Tax=Nocardia tenerifensis TaxID=228006 RepID=A0A318JYL5_9NOCA|nr:WXG100 family type VII secretion target [Nocardia tenerifensis]PXX60388.1 WXG100 family type VII secretion target [Nocardia tenerifensis]
MSDELQVEVARLRDAARFIADKAQTIKDGVVRLDNTIGKELLADGWQGKAASAYDESWVEWKQGAEEIVAALEASARNLVDAAIRYEMRDVGNKDAIVRAGE